MESLGVFADQGNHQWECFSRLFSNQDQQLDFITPHFLGNEDSSFHFQHNDGFHFETPAATTLCPNPDEMGFNRFFHSLDTLNSNMQNLPQDNNLASSGIFTAILDPESNYYFGGNSCHAPMSNDIDVSMTGIIGSFMPSFTDIGMEEALCNAGDCGSGGNGMSEDSCQPPPKELQLKRIHDEVTEEKSNTIEDASESTNPKKKSRLSKDKTKKSNVRSKKGQKGNSDVKVKDEDESNTAGVDRHSTSSYNSSEDDSASQETNGSGEISDPKLSSALNSNGKTRANRGSATDPQSLYARKRRERINERLRVLQNLVPNGTKVDISTMLEEAVHYVKFLQLQIKLLSSDDMWMYAPIAYNGMDIGLDLHKMSPLL